MLNLQALYNEAQVPLTAGNALLPLRAYVAALSTTSHAEKRWLYAEMHSLLAAYGTALSHAERAHIQCLLTHHIERGPLEEALRVLVRQMQALGSPPPDGGIGRVNTLFASTTAFNGCPFGAVHVLEVTAQAWGGQSPMLLKAPNDAVYTGFHQGIRAAQEYLCRQGLGTLDGTILLQSYSFEGHFAQLRCPVGGESLGLGTAVATLSRLLELPVPSGVAFTGRIDVTGRVHCVDKTDVKVTAAGDKGVQLVFVPVYNKRDIPKALPSGLTCVPVESLDEVVMHLFDTAALQAGLTRLQTFPIPAEFRQRHWLVGEKSPDNATRILLTCVGKADPIGQQLDRERSPIWREEGPILTLCREVRPHRVYLLHTCQGKENDYTTKAEQTVAFLKAEDPSCQAEPVPLSAVSDPTDYAQLLPAFKAAVTAILQKEVQPNTTFFVNLSSGTPQMETAWHLLTERQSPRATLLQVREGRFALTDKVRVRRVVLPVL